MLFFGLYFRLSGQVICKLFMLQPWLSLMSPVTQTSKTPDIFRFCSHFKNAGSHSLQQGFAGVSQWNTTNKSVCGTQFAVSQLC